MPIKLVWMGSRDVVYIVWDLVVVTVQVSHVAGAVDEQRSGQLFIKFPDDFPPSLLHSTIGDIESSPISDDNRAIDG